MLSLKQSSVTPSGYFSSMRRCLYGGLRSRDANLFFIDTLFLKLPLHSTHLLTFWELTIMTCCREKKGNGKTTLNHSERISVVVFHSLVQNFT